MSMLRNYLTIALRILVRSKGYTFINLVGLAAGFTCCLLIYLYVTNELIYDRYHARADRLYRVEEGGWATVPLGVGPFLRETMPEVEDAVRFLKVNRAQVSAGEESFTEKRFFFADSSVLAIFSFKLLEGNSASALTAPNSIVLTREMALKYFGTEHALGRRLDVQTSRPFVFTVTGIVESPPPQSHFHFDFLASYSTLPDPRDNNRLRWQQSVSYTYALLHPRAHPQTVLPVLEQRIAAALMEHASQQDTSSIDVRLRPLTDIHLYAECEKEIEPAGSIRTVYVLSSVALVILFLAVINFINLTTARSLRRVREIGVRKAVGAPRVQLVTQFMVEAIVLSLLAACIAPLAVLLLLPSFSALTGVDLSLAGMSGRVALFLLPLVGVAVGSVAGGYPALYLSGFRTAAILKPAAGLSASRPALLRKILAVVQFTISIALIIGSLLIDRQMEYIQGQELGLDKEQVVVMPISSITEERYTALRSELLRSSGIEAVAASFSVPGERIVVEEFHPQLAREAEYYVRLLLGDAGVPGTYGFMLQQGRGFSGDFPADTAGAFMVNEKAAALFGWDTPIGKHIDFPGQHRGGEVVGVVKDFHYASMHTEIEPLLIHLDQNPALYKYISVRIGRGEKPAALRTIEDAWKSVLPGRPFEYYFLDDSFAALYQKEVRLRTIVAAFTVMAIIIASLGLLGLVAQDAERRTKEIGIRKVLGSSVSGVAMLICRDFLLLVLVGNLLAWPLAWFIMQKWLENFAYRIEIGIGTFLLSACLALAAALLALSVQTLRAARANPVEALRYE